MESTDLHHQHHQLQEQLIGSSSLSTTIPSFSSTFSTTNNNNNTSTWNPNLILLGGNLNSNINGLLSNHDHSRQNNENILVPTSNSSMIQELGFHDHQWVGINNGGNNFSSNHSTHELHLARLKEEFPNKFSDQSTINGNTSNLDHNQEFHFPSTRNYIKHENEDMNNLSEKLFLKTFSSSCHLNGLNHIQVSDGDHDFYSNNSQNCASFGSGLASSNRSEIQSFSQNLDQPCSSSPFSSSLGMNLQTLDLWNPSTKFGGCSTQSHPQSNNLGELFKQVHPSSFVLDQHMQESSHTPSYITNKISTFMTNNGGGRSSSGSSAVTDQTKRSSSSSSSSDHHHQPKSPHHQSTSNKKARTEPRSSFPPFKVRKEKLGDRIAALQQLVAPFGKTDTASVLMEAIGYIKFLQDQVETLSVPYMKSTRNMARSSSQGVSCEMNENKETKQDLRSRGLCLVPLSCMSYITNDINGAGVWAIPNFGGGI